MKKKISTFVLITLFFLGISTSFAISSNKDKPPPVPLEFINEK